MAVIQVDPSEYGFDRYLDSRRWGSYYKQIEECRRINPSRVLVIGVGDGLIPLFLPYFIPGVEIKTADFDCRLNPDYCGDVRELRKERCGQFDCIMCCQVLEHIPFSEFQKTLGILKGLIKENGTLILSLPDSGIHFNISIDIPKICLSINKKYARLYKKSFRFDGQHYWEVNSAFPYRAKEIRRIVKYSFCLKDEYLNPSFPFHRFYIAQNNKS